MAFCRSVHIIFLLEAACQILKTPDELRMGFTEEILIDLQGALEVADRDVEFASFLMETAEVRQTAGHLRVIGV